MNSEHLSRYMWSEALSLLDQADRLHRQFFQPASARVPTWEPPVDVVETANGVHITVALPGVEADSVSLKVEPHALTISARRAFPVSSSESRRGARIHALEIPHGRFERRIGLPAKAMSLTGKRLKDGCLTLILSRKESS